ncbi:MAG: hypothetical protein Fur0037_05990 [Planctomycetota bacterium]
MHDGSAPRWEKPRRAVVALWIVDDLLGSAILLGLAAMAREYAIRSRPVLEAQSAAVWFALAALLLLWALVVPFLARARWAYCFDGDLLRMRYGILFHEERIVPVRRMQHVDLTRGPIERLFRLATLVVFTAGNEGSAFRVPGLSAAEAEDLRDRILRARGDDSI